MALGMIGSALVSVAHGMKGFTWWQYMLIFVCILLVISGPSMIMAWLKLRRRNLAPVLNANGWAVNSDAIISVIFGRTLTEQVAFPIVKVKKHHLTPWVIVMLYFSLVAILGLGGYGIYRYMNREKVNKAEVEAVLEPEKPVVEEVESVEPVEPVATVAEEGAE